MVLRPCWGWPSTLAICLPLGVSSTAMDVDTNLKIKVCSTVTSHLVFQPIRANKAAKSKLSSTQSNFQALLPRGTIMADKQHSKQTPYQDSSLANNQDSKQHR